MDKNHALRTQKTQVCDACQKPLPDEQTFREIIVSCLKQGFYILETKKDNRTLDAPYCLCKSRIVSRLSSIRKRRSRIKRKMAFIATVPREKWKSKQSLMQRGDRPKNKSKQKALQRQMQSEDLILWGWELFDASGKAHYLEDILDTPLLRDLISSPAKWSTGSPENLNHLHRILSMLETWLVTTATSPPRDPLDEVETWSEDVEELWRGRLDEDE